MNKMNRSKTPLRQKKLTKNKNKQQKEEKKPVKYLPKKKVALEEPEELRINLTGPIETFKPVTASDTAYAVTSTISTKALQETLYAYMAWLMYHNVPGSVQETGDPGAAYANIYSALSYLQNAVIAYSQGATVEASSIPKSWFIIATMLKDRDYSLVSTQARISSTVNYSAQWDSTEPLPSVFKRPDGGQLWMTDYTAGETIVPPPGVITPTPEGYAYLIKIRPRIFATIDVLVATGISSVELAKRLNRDVSAHARLTPLFGQTSDGVSGLYSTLASEVPCSMPSYAHFAYQEKDVVTRFVRPTGGSASTVVGLQLCDLDYNDSYLGNPIPPCFKFIDMIEIYCQVCSWVVQLFQETPAIFQGNVPLVSKPAQLPFSKLDFLWLLRQCILSVCPDQCYSQFQLPFDVPDGPGNPRFVPFVVDSVLSPVPSFNRLVLPLPLVENIQALRRYSFPLLTSKKGRGRKLCYNWIPVWGYYSNVEIPTFAFTDTNGNVINLFSDTGTIPPCTLTDGLTSNGSKVVVNHYVPGILAKWNEFVAGYAKSKSVQVACLVDESKQAFNLLRFTRIRETRAPQREEIPESHLNMIVNHPWVEKRKSVKSKDKPIVKEVGVTYFDFHQTQYTSLAPIGSDLVGLLNFMVLPTLLTGSQYNVPIPSFQTYYGEFSATTFKQHNFSVSASEITRFLTNGTMCVAGVTGDSNNDVISKVYEQLTNHGNALDFYKILTAAAGAIAPHAIPWLMEKIGLNDKDSKVGPIIKMLAETALTAL